MTTAPYGSWLSSLPIERMTEGVVFLSEPRAAGGVRWWLEGRPEEQGRQVLDPDRTPPGPVRGDGGFGHRSVQVPCCHEVT